MSTANGTGNTTMADIGGDAGKMECVRALSCEYSLPRAAACAVAQSFQAYRAQVLPEKKKQTKVLNTSQKTDGLPHR